MKARKKRKRKIKVTRRKRRSRDNLKFVAGHLSGQNRLAFKMHAEYTKKKL